MKSLTALRDAAFTMAARWVSAAAAMASSSGWPVKRGVQIGASRAAEVVSSSVVSKVVYNGFMMDVFVQLRMHADRIFGELKRFS